ncbi:Vegetative incompatibility protein HET-E-1 [Madurella mycetomatis]|uniref:Vegetative incompatibility protein HET-E-1 n=1 Tax=Madurella mycetomatis TaxID=100816 RepID=A0A175WG97_9PEZI|nr:Vegetative incompatibility protein HET-E-1 [Madurella mycetomatis]
MAGHLRLDSGPIFLGTPFRGTHDSLSQGEILRRAQELFTESPVYGENLEILRSGGESLTDLVDMYFRIARQSTMPRVVCFYEQGASEVGDENKNSRLIDPAITDSRTDKCIEDLRVTDPRDDKFRIEQTKGILLADAYQWVFGNAQFRQWRDDEQNRLLWIKGDPGKGKTMLLCGIIDELHKSMGDTGLISFFFCQAADQRINNATAVLRGLIYLLAKRKPSLIAYILERHRDAGKQLFEGVNAWAALSQIFTSMLQDPDLPETVLIIDALDECVIDMPWLLDFIVKSHVFPKVRWIVSSRNWPDIEETLDLTTQKVRLCLELNEDSISTAVGIYISNKVDQLARAKKCNDDTRDAIQRHLSANANDTFLWVALVCQNLKKVRPWNILTELNKFPPGLDPLYQRMMDQIYTSGDADICKQILAIMSTVYRPITLIELTSFLEPLKDISNDQSAKEFLLTKAFDQISTLSTAYLHYTIFSASLRVMSETLRRDVYDLRHPGFPIDEVAQPEPDPLAKARYSCVYWVNHLKDCDPTRNAAHDLQDGESVDEFLRRNYLHWLEALSLLKSISEGVLSMANLDDLLQREKYQLADFVRDGRRFIQSHKLAIEQSPLQVYAAALVFSPARSIIRNCFRNEEPEWIIKKPTVEDDWNACLQTLEGHSDWVSSIAWSHDGIQLASASHDQTIKIWEANTGRCISTLEDHSAWVSSVTWSHDGIRLASASGDYTIKVWEATTGRCISTLEGHSEFVMSVAWSRDGIRLASASGDRTIKIWEATTGRCISTLEGCEDLSSLRFAKGLPGRLYTNVGTFDLQPIESFITVTFPFSRTSSPVLNSTGYGLNSRFNWITYEGRNILWLPPDHRSSRASAVYGTNVAIGSSSGSVLLLRFSKDPLSCRNGDSS